MKILLSVIASMIGMILIGLIIMYSGWINVSAMERPTGFTKWILSSTMKNSIKARTEDIKVPDLDNEAMINEGAEHYIHMCQGCHGAPGLEETELAKGLEPPAPRLYKEREPGSFNAASAYWITKNGIMMTAMPAWGKTHSDEKIWDIVAFLKKLPEMSPAEYNKLVTEINSKPMEEQ